MDGGELIGWPAESGLRRIASFVWTRFFAFAIPRCSAVRSCGSIGPSLGMLLVWSWTRVCRRRRTLEGRHEDPLDSPSDEACCWICLLNLIVLFRSSLM